MTISRKAIGMIRQFQARNGRKSGLLRSGQTRDFPIRFKDGRTFTLFAMHQGQKYITFRAQKAEDIPSRQQPNLDEFKRLGLPKSADRYVNATLIQYASPRQIARWIAVHGGDPLAFNMRLPRYINAMIPREVVWARVRAAITPALNKAFEGHKRT